MEYVMAIYHDRETAESALSDLERGNVRLDYSIIDRGQGMAGWWQRLFGARNDGGSLESARFGLPDVTWYDEQLSHGRALAVVRADGFADRIASLLRVRGASDVRRYERQDGEWRRVPDAEPERWGLRDDARTPEAMDPAPERAAVAAALGPDVVPAPPGSREERAPARTAPPPPYAPVPHGAAARTEDRLARETEPAAPDTAAAAADAAGRSRQRELEAENSKLRRLVVEQALDIAELRAALKAPKP
jgi:hypothetical protein